ncbi:hypothetical protein halTADL_2243 [Halohasta litchfieldiae]|jgi:DNA-directed RNA polymerase subunit RPC12/RpoP|uniref:TRASH domain-containing protein n=1 Tax=Halohasta litchfieldiae TaxID=1073996 RepID=A0A1H6VGB9_9EURY|nr:hypothetical protein [Halohasta litchfieldiae]ATW88990.1 hypothetical protein halTADL_2243 [Halohasta litchfieldiae]SEJ02024.1 hypothetical protein SAMN05444271_11663 [Halohasta litchfieldiae]
MVDPTSDIGEDVTEENAPECEQCSSKIIQSTSHRVVSEIEDGRAVHHHFCSDDCHDEWLAA